MPQLQFGVATRDITPTSPAWLDGYNARPAPLSGVAERLSLGCLAVAGGRKTVLLICCDLLGLEVPECAVLYQLLEKATGIAYPDILISCSHTHFAPTVRRHDGFAGAAGYFVEPDPVYWADFKTKLVEAAQESLRNLQPGRLETVRAAAPQVHYNRRTRRHDGSVVTNFLYPANPAEWELRPVDSELTVLRFRTDAGVRAIFVNFGCHPVTGWGIPKVSADLVSADYPYYLRETLQARYGCPVLFSLGTAGDVVPMDRLGDCRQRIGSILGNTAILAERRYQPDPSTKLATAAITIKAKTRIRRHPAQVERDFRRLMAEHGPRLYDPSKPAGSQIYGTPAWDKFQLIMDDTIQVRQYPDNGFAVPLQFIRLGSTVLTVLPFEVLSEISLTMKARFPHSVLVSCAGGYQGYLPLAHEFKRGGYEVSASASHFAPGTADRILAAVLEKLSTF